MVGAGIQLRKASKLLDSGAARAARFLWRYPTAQVFVHLSLMYLLHHLQQADILLLKKLHNQWDLPSPMYHDPLGCPMGN